MVEITKIDIARYAAEAAAGINEMAGLPYGYDQTRGNQCHLLTLAVMNMLQRNHPDAPIRRELHQDSEGNWHYVLAHNVPDAKPTDTDMISDLNPWQWGGAGQGILHMPRGEAMNYLTKQGAPAHFVALRGIETIVQSHHLEANPHR